MTAKARPMFPILPAAWTRLALMLLTSGVLVFSTGCTSFRDYVRNGFKVGPNYQKPPAPVASEWIDSKSTGVKTVSADLSNWWTQFKDPALNSLVDEAYRQNLDLRTAGTRILAARAQRNIAAGNLFPQLQEAFADHNRNQLSSTVANPADREVFGTSIGRRFFNDTAVGVNLSWELDFWGRFRRAIEAADGELDASIENYDDALVLLISEVAANYVQIRVAQERIQYADANIATQRILVAAAEGRLKGGVGRMIDQGQQRSNLTNTLALREELEIGLRLANNRLCVLLGIPVRDLIAERLKEGPTPTAPPEVAVGMPADLLRRRPDLRRAERLVAAQSARIGIATADLYPRISLIGALGYESENFTNLFNSRSFIGTVGPSLRWDILNYGRLLNGIRVQDAVFQQRVLEYQSTVLRAGREVEDGIVAYLRAQTQARQLTDSAKEADIAAKEAVTLSKDVKYDLNQAFVTSNFLVTQQDKLAGAKGDIALGLILIYKALGGGWEIRLDPSEMVGPTRGRGLHLMSRPHARLLPPVISLPPPPRVDNP